MKGIFFGDDVTFDLGREKIGIHAIVAGVGGVFFPAGAFRRNFRRVQFRREQPR